MASAVHLTGVRCGGDAHGGCQAGCLIFWKDAWLRKIGDGPAGAAPAPPATSVAPGARPCTEEDVAAGVYRADGSTGSDEPEYVCQSTRLQAATTPLPWWDLRQYANDLRSGNVRLSQMAAALLFFAFQRLTEAGLGLGAAMRWAYDTLQTIRGGTPYPLRAGRIPNGVPTPSAKLDLQRGELVKVRSYAAILETLNQDWHNRGMYFDSEQVPFCNGIYRVLRRVERIIDEKTGRMTRLQSDAVILEEVTCQARYAKCRRFCPRGIYPYWREIWVDRVR
jgi:hypothetical protein